MFIKLIVITILVNLIFFFVHIIRKIEPTLFGTWWDKTTKYLVIVNFTMRFSFWERLGISNDDYDRYAEFILKDDYNISS